MKNASIETTKPAAPKLISFDERSLRVIRALSWLMVSATVGITLVYLSSGYWPKIGLAAFVATVFSVPLVLLRFKKFRATKFYFFSQFVFISLLLPLAVGSDARSEWMVTLLPVLAYVLFDREWHALFLSMAAIGYLCIAAVYEFHTPWMVSTYPGFYRFALATLTATFIYWLIVLFKKETLRSEEIIREQHTHLLENQQLMVERNRELLEANRELDRQQTKLKLLNKELQSFAHMASHDMKEPLRNISSFSSLLARQMGDDPAKRELLGFIENGARRMNRMLDDLITHARIGSENAPRMAVDLNDLMTVVRHNFSSSLERSGGQIVSMPLPVLNAHHTLLTQLFQNIIGNGLKYCRPGEPPLVQIRFIKKDGNALLVFRDNGIGIGPENLEKIFEPFRRLHSQSEIEGSGIGLSTCRKIVDLYGGKIYVESELGIGTAISVEFPGEMVVEMVEVGEERFQRAELFD